MGHKHLPWKRLREEHADGTLDPERITEMLYHLAESCPECRLEMEAFHKQIEVQSYSEAFAKQIALLQELSEELEVSRWHAKEDLSRLLELPPERRRSTIERARNRYRSPFLVDLMLDECHRTVTRDPFAALELAECAHAVALRISHVAFGEAWAMMCTARAHSRRDTPASCGAHPLRPCG